MPKTDETPKIFTDTPVRLATSNKHDGHMSFGKTTDQKTVNNINRFINRLGWPIKNFVFMRILYSDERTYDEILVITGTNQTQLSINKDTAPAVDAAITDQIGTCLLLPTADCFPVTTFDPANKVLALAHMGWQSTAAHLLAKVIEQMAERFGSKPEDLLVHIGPGIPAEHYTLAQPAQLSMPDWREHIRHGDDGYGIDLLSYNLEQLSLAGIEGEHIEIDPRDTVNSDKFESHHHHTKQDLSVARRFLTAAMMAQTPVG